MIYRRIEIALLLTVVTFATLRYLAPLKNSPGKD